MRSRKSYKMGISRINHEGADFKNLLFPVIVFSLLLFLDGKAWAFDASNVEYYTYGGFSAVVMALQKITLIFSDHGFKSLMYVSACVGLFCVIVKVCTPVFDGASGSLKAFLIRYFVGVIFYICLFSPTGNMTVYDPVFNRMQTVGNIPIGINLVMGGLNLIERSIIEIIDTSGEVDSFQYSAGGIGFNILLETLQGGYGLGDTYADESMKKYVEDCVFFELRRPGTDLNPDAIRSSSDFMTEFAKAVNPAIYTVYYNSTTGLVGQTMTCTEAWTNLSSDLNTYSRYDATMSQVCARVGYRTGNANELAKCKSDVSGFLEKTSNGALSIPAANIFRQRAMAEAYDNIITKHAPDSGIQAFASRNMMNSGISMGIVANAWMPVLRGVFTAIALGLLPFIILFLPTGISNKSISFIVGMFLWLTCWGIIDAFLHSISTDYSLAVCDEARQYNIGYMAIMLYPNDLQKGLAFFGMVRVFGMMLATVFAGMLVNFGGHAMAMLAGSFSSHIQGTATQAGNTVNTPEGSSSEIEALRNSTPAWDNAHRFKHREDVDARAAIKMGQTQGAIDAMNLEGGKTNFSNELAAGNTAGHFSNIGTGRGAKGVGYNAHARTSEVGTRTSAAEASNISDLTAQRVGNNRGMQMKHEAWNNTAQKLVDLKMASSLDDAYHQMAKVSAGGGVMNHFRTQGQLDALGDNIIQERDIAAQEKGIQIGSSEQKQNIMDYFGMDSKEYGRWNEGGRVLSNDMASQLKEDGWSGAEEGMKADLGFSKDGEISYMTGKKETGEYGATYSGGKLMESFTRDGYSMTQIKDANGNILHTQGIKGKNMLNEDRNMTISEHGFKSWSGSDIQRVNRNLTVEEFGSRSTTYNVKETHISDGTVYNTGTMYGMTTTTSGSRTVAGQIVKAAPGEMRDRELYTAASAYAKSVSEIAAREGYVVDTSSTAAHGGFDFKFVGVKAAMDIASNDRRGINLVAQQFVKTGQKAMAENPTQAHLGEAIRSMSLEHRRSFDAKGDYGAKEINHGFKLIPPGLAVDGYTDFGGR